MALNQPLYNALQRVFGRVTIQKDGEAMRYRVVKNLKSQKNQINVSSGQGGEDYKEVIKESLEHLTGEEWADDGRAWKKWWRGAKGRYRPEPLPDDFKVDWLFDDKKNAK